METDFILIPLYDHQKKSIQYMEDLEKKSNFYIDSDTFIETKIGILSDLPGYGKTLSVIGYIGKTRHETEEDFFLKETVESVSKTISKIKIKKIDQLSVSLILVNVSLLSQWIFELARTTLRYLAIYSKSDIEGIDMSKYDLILVSHNIYNLFCQVYRNKCWKRFIIDEPASLKISSMEEVTAKFYWLVTATPYELYPRKRTGFLNDILPDFEIVKYIIKKNDDQYVKISYDMPITNHIYYKISCDISKLFQGIVNQNAMEMIEAGNINGVLHLFGSNTDNLIESYKNRKKKRISELISDEENIEKIQIIQQHLSLLDERLRRYASENLCIICKNFHQQLYLLTCCQTLCCEKCSTITSCPICKTSDIHTSHIEIDDFPEYTTLNINTTKIKQVMDIISDSLNKKILIFSNFNESFTIIKKYLDDKKILYLELRGTKEKRDNTIDLYKTGNVNVLLLNTIHSGAGLNLQETTDIIMYHRLHDYQKTQVIGRANRIGRKLVLNVHYLE
jgi:hypothetical protein